MPDLFVLSHSMTASISNSIQVLLTAQFFKMIEAPTASAMTQSLFPKVIRNLSPKSPPKKKIQLATATKHY